MTKPKNRLKKDIEASEKKLMKEVKELKAKIAKLSSGSSKSTGTPGRSKVYLP
jgi:hypothetical protein